MQCSNNYQWMNKSRSFSAYAKNTALSTLHQRIRLWIKFCFTRIGGLMGVRRWYTREEFVASNCWNDCELLWARWSHSDNVAARAISWQTCKPQNQTTGWVQTNLQGPKESMILTKKALQNEQLKNAKFLQLWPVQLTVSSNTVQPQVSPSHYPTIGIPSQGFLTTRIMELLSKGSLVWISHHKLFFALYINRDFRYKQILPRESL